jgi:hypothetical protein
MANLITDMPVVWPLSDQPEPEPSVGTLNVYASPDVSDLVEPNNYIPLGLEPNLWVGPDVVDGFDAGYIPLGLEPNVYSPPTIIP